jgi:hypothetical protein
MSEGTKGLNGRVAVIDDGGGPVGRAVALALAARKVQVVVSGPTERSLGETVGEIAYGGGKARHVAGSWSGAIARAETEFGAIDFAIVTRAECTLPVQARLALRLSGDEDADAIGAAVVALCACA